MDAFAGEAFDIADPTDWLNTPLAGLMPVEQSLRCHVCKDFFNTPMLTSCNHTFCSICIRRCIQTDQKCPLCRKEDTESRLRGNWAMREAVDAFVDARDAILKFAKTPPPAPVAVQKSPKRKAGKMAEADEEDQGSKRPRRSGRSTSASARDDAWAEQALELDEDELESEDEYVPETDDGLVACPICSKRMKLEKVDRHLDTTCPGPDAPQFSPPLPRGPLPRRRGGNALASSSSSSTSKNPTDPPPSRLPALPYSMLKDVALRKKLSELGISTAGSRPILEKRHQEWVTLWNANCDSQNPRSRQELLHDLNVWEKTMGSRAPTSSKAATTGAQIKDKNFDGGAWAATHDDSFKDLIANARQSKMLAQQKSTEAAKEDERG
ncbi:hypothetical protein QBC44DRAFT_318350 [Cladorrhinum sp. PSN332]|nr:hypothetical protein QBC44DRAFT_318350 [Cladorrhinum sp. PSN332]